jgi:hypothetical protein
MEQVIEVTLGTSSIHMQSDVTTDHHLFGDVVLLQDAYDDDEILDTQVTVKDPIFLIIIEDCATYYVAEVNTEEPQVTDEDPPMEAMSPPTAIPRKVEDLACPMHPPSPFCTRTRCRCKSYDRSSCQNVHLAQRGVLKDLDISI